MEIGELVWVKGQVAKPTWGIIVNEFVVFLTDNSVMVSYEVLVDSVVYPVDPCDVLRFHYYNRHLRDETTLLENR